MLLLVIAAVLWMKLSSPPPEAPKVEGPSGPSPERIARIAELLRRAEDLEAKGRFAEALAILKDLAALEPNDPRLATLKPRLEEKVRRLAAWRGAHERAEEARADAARRDTPADWQKVLDACAEAEKHAPAEEQQRLTRELTAMARQRRDWAAAREEERKGNLAGAIELATQAVAAREPPPELAAYKSALERKKRKQEFDRVAAVARAETQPARAMELWQQARTLADDPKDIEDVERKIDALRPRVDVAERDRRYDAAMKSGEAALGAGRLEEAEKAFRDAQALKATDLKAGQALARVEVARKQKAFEAALAEGRDLERKKEWSKAIDAYDRALRIRPGDPAAGARRKEIEEVHRPPRIMIVLDDSTGIKMEFVLIRPGAFRMGDAQGDPDEKLHDVAITKDFWMQATEVTQAQWGVVMPSKPWSFSSSPNLALEGVSWDEVQKFFEKLNAVAQGQLKGRKASLPTEAEWEYACRAGTTTRWNFGNDEAELEDHGWYTRNAGRGPQPVGKKRPNAWGLFDMHGNVAEWCEDWYGNYPEKAADPAGPDAGQFRCFRGGSWNDRAVTCRSGNRERDLSTRGSMFVGFRGVLR